MRLEGLVYQSRRKQAILGPRVISIQEQEQLLADIATMAHPGDNCAIAIKPLRQGTRFAWKGGSSFFLVASCYGLHRA